MITPGTIQTQSPYPASALSHPSAVVERHEAVIGMAVAEMVASVPGVGGAPEAKAGTAETSEETQPGAVHSGTRDAVDTSEDTARVESLRLHC